MAIASEEGEDTYEHEQSDHTGDEADGYENEEENEEFDRPNSPSAHTSIAEANTEYSTGQAENFEDGAEENKEESTGTNVDGNTADEEIDYSDDELDLSSLKQGKPHLPFTSYFSHCTQRSDCRCDACFNLEFERELARIDATWGLWRSSSTLLRTAIVTPPSHCYLSQEQSSHNQQHYSTPELCPSENTLVTDSYTCKDQAPASPQDYTHIHQKESNGLTTTGPNDSNPLTPPTNGSADAPNSDATSVTATLTGDDKDEIDYSDNDEEIVGDKDALSNSGSGAPTTLKTSIDDEITWESENEDARNDLTTTTKQTVQVSPTSGKRPRSDSDLPEGATEQHDVKRRRPS
ncbi:hypothetical protein M434DRAFT_245291 [Hypoxylon sp. CO27-5]|nr:hypothetical protein M434DRAFT_245291 [Hypoxylon sp. CO27-5]